MTPSTTSSGQTLTAFFDERSDAERAVQRLRDAGIAPSSIRLNEGGESGGGSTSSSSGSEDKGFFESLSDLFFPEEDRHTYAEGLSRGGYLLCVVDVPEAQRMTALDILDDEGAVDLDEREASWRSEGWTGYGAGAYGSPNQLGTQPGTSPGMTDYEGHLGAAEPDRERQLESGFAEGQAPFTGAGTSAGGYSDRSYGEGESVEIVEERLRVGKRDVSHGRVRVRSYVVEEPVSAEVNLHDERVEIDRRRVDRPLSAGDAAFQERTIEAEEHIEEAVVGKDARVVEEVSLRKESEDRTETVSDTVRHTEVEIEDERGLTDRDTRRS